MEKLRGWVVASLWKSKAEQSGWSGEIGLRSWRIMKIWTLRTSGIEDNEQYGVRRGELGRA